MTRRRVALVDDNADNRFLLGAILWADYAITEYENGRDTVAGVTRDPPDVLLLDISLPDIDGEEVLARIRAHDATRTLPVIALTANALPGDREHYLAGGFDAYVSKPVLDETVLLGAIAALLKPRS